MRVDVLTLFPDTMNAIFSESILGRSQKKGILSLNAHQIRDYTTNRQNQVDDYPYGGGRGPLCRPTRCTAAGRRCVMRRADRCIRFICPPAAIPSGRPTPSG